jgi:hypothetical protein
MPLLPRLYDAQPFRSKAPRRASEATTLRAHLDGLLAGRGREMAVALMGDMNDELDAATTLILNGPPGSEIDTDGFEQPDQGDGDRMWNLPPTDAVTLDSIEVREVVAQT